jgi:hypothetical protein
MQADLGQFGREYSCGALIGGKGLIKLSHMPANGRGFVNEAYLKAGSRKIKGGLDTADPSTNHHDISKMPVSKTI